MNNPNINKLGYNTIPEQKLTYANQLTVREWNIIVNSLRAQTNGTVDFLRELYPWLIQDLNLIELRITQINEQLPSGTSKILMGNNIPTNSTPGEVGQLYIVTSNPPAIYQCYGNINNNYEWEEFVAGISLEKANEIRDNALPYVSNVAPESEERIIWFDTSEDEALVDDTTNEVLEQSLNSVSFGTYETNGLTFENTEEVLSFETDEVLTFGENNENEELTFEGETN